jgi:hypothetical protein
MSKNREKKHSDHLAERKAHAHEVVESAAEHHETHLVEAPKGTSRARFLFNFLLVVFLLVIFSITGPMMSTLSGGGGATGEIAMSWTTPDGERISIEVGDWYTEKQRIAKISNFGPYLLLGQLDPGDDLQLARFVILESLAQRAGIYVADEEVADAILENFGTKDNYDTYIAQTRGRSAAAFEAVLRRGLVVRRYIQMAALSAGEVLSEDVRERWQLGAKEHDFEYVEVLTDDFEEAARAVLPADDELEDWFNSLPEWQKQEFNTEPSFAFDVAWLDPGLPTVYTQLFERYPRPEEEDAQQQAELYFNRHNHVRFVRPEPAEEEETEDETEVDPQDRFFTLEEVSEQVNREAPIYASLMDWLSDMRKRESGGESVDLETEAISLGMQFARVEPRTVTALRDAEEPWAGLFFAGTLSRVPEGQFTPRITVEAGALVTARVIEILPPSLPPFAEIRDRVADKWVDERRPIIAAEALEAIRDAFGERPAEEGEAFVTSATAEEFLAAVEAAGYEVQKRGWATQYPRQGDTEVRATLIENYLRSRMTLFSMDPDGVDSAEATRDGQAAYLVRYVGSRDGDIATMRPIEVASALGQVQQTALTEFFSSTIGDFEWLRREFNLFLRVDDLAEEDGA